MLEFRKDETGWVAYCRGSFLGHIRLNPPLRYFQSKNFPDELDSQQLRQIADKLDELNVVNKG